MADEGSHIPGSGGGDFEAAAKKVLRDAQAAAKGVEEAESRATRAVEKGGREREQLRRRFEARAIVDEQGRPVGGIRGAARSSKPLHEIIDTETGQRAAGTGEYTRSENARRRAAELSRAADQEVDATRKAERTKTAAVQEGARKRTEAARAERNVVSGNAREFERISGDIAADARRQVEIHRASTVDPKSPEVEREILEQRRRAEALEQVAQRQEEIKRSGSPDFRRALAGGRDPQFGEALRRFGPDVTQYQIRQQLEGVGSRRATAIQQAARAGLRAPDAGAEYGAVTRAQAAHQGVAAADVELTAAKREYTQTTRAASKQQATQEDVTAAYNRQQTALTRRTAALAEVKAAETAADEAAARAARGEAIARQRSAGAGQYPAPAGPPRRPPGFGQYPTAIGPEGRPEGFGQYPAPIGPERRPPRFGADPRQYAQPIGPQVKSGMDSAREAAAALGQEQQRLGRSLQYSAITADLSADKFRKHGALTTEFIEAAAKGEVTIGELGYQMTATIGKFAGWTAAASAVYGMVAALGQLTKGAIDSASGVDLVHRVVTEQFNPEQLQQGFRGLSEKFNVPIDEVAQAVYGAGKVFNDLPGSLEGADSALFAMKVGELDAATATQALTAIVNGFKLSSGDLPALFDDINQAQNRFGGNVGQLTQGVGRAAGQFRAAGGTYRELVAILTTGARVTGAPATEIATAISRSASTVRTPAGAARARAAGLDPTLDPLALIQQAQRLAVGQSPERVQELARSIIPSGGQFARIMVPLIQNAELLNKVLAETSPDKAKGSAQRELARALHQVNEQIASLGVGLQRVGAAAAETGLLTPFGLLLRTLNFVIGRVEDLFKLFDTVVPDPLEPVLSTALQLYGVVRLLRRFDVGGHFAPGGRAEGLRQYVSRPAAVTERRQVIQGVDAERKFLAESRARVASQAAVARQREAAAAERFGQAMVGGADDATKLRRAAEYQRALQRADDLVQEEAELRTAINEADDRRNAIRRNIKAGMAPAEAAAAAGSSYRTESFARPTTQGPVPVGGAARSGAAAVEREAAVAATAVSTAAAEQSRLRRALGPSTAAALTVLPTQLRGVAANAERLGVSARTATAVAGTAGRAMTAAGTGLRGLGGAFRGLGASILASLGPLDLAIGGALIAYYAANKFKEDQEKKSSDLDKTVRRTSDPSADYKRATEALKSGPDTRDIQSLENAQNDAAARIKLQARGVGLGRKQIDDALKTARASAGGPSQEADAIRAAIEALGKSWDLGVGPKQAAKVQSRIRQLKTELAAVEATGSNITDALKATTDFKGLDAFTERQAAEYQLAGGRGKHARGAQRGLGLSLQRAVQLYGETGDIAGYLKSLKDTEDTVVDAAQDRLDRALDVARTPGQRRRARRSYEAEVSRGFGIDRAERRVAGLGDNIRERAQQREDLRAQTALGRRTGGGQAPERAQAELRKLDQLDANDRKERRNLQQAIGLRRQKLRDIARKGAEEDFQFEQEFRAAETALGAARRPAGEGRIRYQLTRMGQTVNAVIVRYGRNSVEAMRAMSDQIELRNQLVQEQAGQIQAETDYAAAGAGTDSGANAIRSSGLQRLVGFQRAHPRQFSRTDVLQTLTQIRELQKQTTEQVRQDAEDFLNAKAEYDSSLTDDPVKLARIQERLARQLLARGGFKTPAERLRAQAQVNKSVRDREKAVADQKVDQINFDAEIGRITQDAQIRALRGVERTLRRGSQLRKDVHRQILRLQHESAEASESFSLDVGNIRLPSIYEVHRAIKEGRRGANAARTAVVNNSPTLNVYLAPGDDGTQVIRTLDQQLGTSARSALRAGAEIGV